MKKDLKNITDGILNDASIREAKNDNDTLRLWESHKEQSALWRALALLQVPVTFVAIVFAMAMYYSRDIYLQVPEKPAPGIYKADEIPGIEFIGVASNYINLIATYNLKTAAKQFDEAQKYLVEPVLTQFNTEILGEELKIIQQTRRSQVFWIDPEKTTIERGQDGKSVIVKLSGLREKRVGDKPAPEVETTYIVTLSTIPRNSLSPYGIVITHVNVESGAERS